MAAENVIPKRLAQRKWIVLAMLLIGTVALQVGAAQVRSFWEDEAFTGGLMATDFTRIIAGLKADNHPPLYWLSVFVWSKFFGASELGLKSFSILCLVVTCLLTYKVAVNLFDKNVALIAVGMLVFSPLVLTYAHNARYYSMAAALSLLLVWMLDSYVRTGKLLCLLFYVLVGVSLFYTLYTGATLLLALNLCWFIQWVRGNRKPARLVVWIVAQGLILLLYAPLILTLIAALQRNLPSELGSSNWVIEIALRIGYLGYAFSVGEFLSPLNLVTWLGIATVVGLTLLAFVRGKRTLWLPIVILFVVGGINIGFNLIALYPQSAWQSLPNRLFFVYPFFIMILAYGIAQVDGKWRWGTLVVVLMVYMVATFNYFSDREVIKPILITPWREIMTNIQGNKSVDAMVVCTNADFACSYYQERYGFVSFSSANWERASAQRPSEIWWIQSNLGNRESPKDANAFAQMQAQYTEVDKFNYGPQDDGIAMLKAKLLGHHSYQYRVVVYKYTLP